MYVYYISSSRKKRTKVKVESKLRIGKTNMVFLFLSFPGGLLVLKGVQLQTSTYRSAASDGFSGLWSLRERIVAFLGYCRRRMRDDSVFFDHCLSGREKKEKEEEEGGMRREIYTCTYLLGRMGHTVTHLRPYVPCVIGLGSGWLARARASTCT